MRILLLSNVFEQFNNILKISAVMCFTLAALLYASEDTVDLDKMIITARGYEKPVTNTPGGVGIIIDDDIEENQGVSVTNLLELVPGASKCSDGAWGSDISIRGLNRDRVLMLIDNIRINTASALNFKLGTIDPAWVERIEILKGPISSIYGSGSFGGVVNVITKKGYFSQKPEFDAKVSLGYGSNGFSKRLFGYGAYNTPNYYISLGMSGRDQNVYTDGYGDFNDDGKNEGGDEVRSTQFADAEGKLNAGVKLNKLNRIDLTVDYFRGENVGTPGGTGNMPGSPVGKPDISYAPCSRLLIDATYSYTPENSLVQEYKLQLNYVNLYRLVYFRNFPTKSDYPTGTPISKLGSTFLDSIKAYTRHPSYSLKSYIVLAPENHKIVTGVDVLIRTSEQGRERWFNANPPLMSGNQNNYVKDAPFPNIFFLTGGVFAEDDWSIGEHLEFNYGGRIDGIYVKNEADSLWYENKNKVPPNKLLWTEGEETEVSWDAHVGVTGKILENLKTTALFSRGYRAASMEERYRYVDLGSKKQYGNPELEPEQSLFAELGIHFTHKIADASFAFYHNYIQDLVQESPPDTVIVNNMPQISDTLINIGEARLLGTEFSLAVRPVSWLSLFGTLAYVKGTDITDEDTTKPLASIPPFNGTAGIKIQPKIGLWFTFSGAATAAAHADDIPGGIPAVDKWVRFNTRLGYNIKTASIRHKIYIGADNLFNTLYQDYLTTSRGQIVYEPGFSFVAGYYVDF